MLQDLLLLVSCNLYLRPQKSLGSHQHPCLIFTPQKTSHALCKILSLGKHVKSMHFSDDWYFSISKNKNHLPSSFFFFFLMRTKTFIFRGLMTE